jgi:hypothetical protein
MELSIEFRIPDVPLLNGQGSQVVDEELRRGMNAAVLIAKGEIVPQVPVGATGLLRQGIATEVTGEAQSLTGRVFDPVAYAAPVEEGSRPHFPPVGALEVWVRRVLGISDEREAHSVAFVIARAISRRGTPARRFFAGAYERIKPRVLGLFEQANSRIAQRLMGGR